MYSPDGKYDEAVVDFRPGLISDRIERLVQFEQVGRLQLQRMFIWLMLCSDRVVDARTA